MYLVRLFTVLFVIFLITPYIVVAQQVVDIDALCIVKRVVDGDTIDVLVTRVFDKKYFMLNGREVRVRFADINAPEIYTVEGKAAKDFLYGLVQGRIVYLDIDDLYVYDRYGRIVAVVYLPVNNTTLLNVNLYLVVKGYAEITDYPNEFNPTTWRLYLEKNTMTTSRPSATVKEETKTVTITHLYITTRTVEETTTKTTYTTITITKTQQALITQRETITMTQTITVTAKSSQSTGLGVDQVIIVVLLISIGLNIALLYRVLKK